jgi:[ribosomal protein S18]-alanine N-acetyltransferase
MRDFGADPVDAIMAVMDAAFDPAFGEAWNRRQLGDALVLNNSHYFLADACGRAPEHFTDTAGFLLSRGAADEEELLLLAVMPGARGRGIGSALIARFAADAAKRGVARLFLQMREGNGAEALYRANGFEPIGRRREYYRGPDGNRIDAITFARVL